MPMVNIEFDDSKIAEVDIKILSEAVQVIVSKVTGIKDVFVYANSSKIRVKIAPIEIWIRMSAWKITDMDKLMLQIKTDLSRWKAENKFPHPINLSIIPMQWKVEIDI